MRTIQRDDYIDKSRDKIPGWFRKIDAELFVAIDDAQTRQGITGDLLEVGCYQGASAILLEYMRKSEERLVVCDLFEGPSVNEENDVERRRWYGDLSRQSFQKNFLTFHAALPEIIEAPSHVLSGMDLGRRFRFVHIDGSHVYDSVRADILLTKSLLVDGGVVVCDDVISPHTPGVTAAVWEAVVNDRLVPMFQTFKFYCSWGTPPTVMVPSHLFRERHKVFGHDMFHLEEHFPAAEEPQVGKVVADLDSPHAATPEPQWRNLLRAVSPPVVLSIRRSLLRKH